MRLLTKFNLFILSLIALLISSFTFAAPVSAHCPLCVAGAAFGVTLTRWIGVDDSITGVWIAALLGAMSFWFTTWIISKNPEKLGKFKKIFNPIVYILVFGSTIWSFYQFKLVIRMSQIFGLDKLTFGILAGGILFYLIDVVDDALIKKNGKVFFPYQRIFVSLGSMVILSLLIYMLINFII